MCFKPYSEMPNLCKKKAAGIKETTTYVYPEAFAVTECSRIFSG
jgi:hypothetical protein